MRKIIKITDKDYSRLAMELVDRGLGDTDARIKVGDAELYVSAHITRNTEYDDGLDESITHCGYCCDVLDYEEDTYDDWDYETRLTDFEPYRLEIAVEGLSC